MEALPLLRVASGSELNAQVDPVWMGTSLKSIGPDGLFYVPLNGRPWSRVNSSGVDPVWRADGTKISFENPSVGQFSNSVTCQRMISTMTLYYLRDRNPMWKQTMRRMIQRLSDLAIRREDYCYYPAGSFEPNARLNPQAEIPIREHFGDFLELEADSGAGAILQSHRG